MGIELIVVGASIAIAAALAAYAILSAQKNKPDEMNPASLDSFNVTRAQEGLAVPLIYGRVRTPGNIIWYGDLQTEEIESEPAEGGKGFMGGGGGESQVTGYKYYLSVWEAISFGQISLIKTYIDDAENTVQAANIIFNDGTTSGYPTNVPKANKLPGIAHIYYDTWYLGDNSSTVPTVHFVVERILPSTLPNANLATGSNPAAVIYDLLIQGGVSPSLIDLDSFTDAANFFTLGLNVIFTQQTGVSEAIERILKYVDALLYVAPDGKYALKIEDPSDSFAAELTELEFLEFSLNRKTWGQVPNDFHATFLDESQAFTQRVVVAQNPAGITLAKSRITQSIDLKCYRDLNSASKRLFEIMKRASYPAAEVRIKTTLKYSELLPGDVIRLSHADYGIVAADYRVKEVDAAGLEKNEITLIASQQVETLFDDVYVDGGGSGWAPGDIAPVELTHVRLFELPYNSITQAMPAFVVLAARENLKETAFTIMTSAVADSGFRTVQLFRQFSQYGTLAAEYPAATRTIDDEIGIEFTVFQDDPQFDTLTRSALFTTNRVAIIDDEIIAFQIVTALGGGQFRLSGCIRGVMGTTKATHAIGAAIWLAYLADNIFVKSNIETFYYKVIPRHGNRSLDAGDVTATLATITYKARVPRNPGRIIATRSGNTISINLWPSSPSIRGAGDDPPSVVDSKPPFPLIGDFEVTWLSTTVFFDTADFFITQSGAVTITIKSRINGYLSSGKAIVVGASNGVYKS